MIKGAIFDMDGTLTDSMHIWSAVGPKYLRSIGYEPREGLSDVVRGMSLYQGACYYKSEYGVTLSLEEIMNGVNAIVEELYMTDTSLKHGAQEFLLRLKEMGVKMCIASATDRYLVEKLLKKLGILHYFDEIFTCGSVGHGKDEPVIYREALKYLGTEKSKTVVFEDAFYALNTVKNDGFLAAVIYDKHEKRREQMKELADVYMDDYADAENFFSFAKSL